MKIRYLTAGESHGPALTGIIEGLPAHLPIDLTRVNHELYRRQQGFGRGGRMSMEKDKIEVLSGIRFNKTLGSPISFVLRNKDWANWSEIMSQGEGKEERVITRPRPGHADLAGAFKYNFQDMRNILERSSARETAMRVAVGAFCKELLYHFGISILSHVVQIGPVKADWQKIRPKLKKEDANQLADQSPVRCLDEEASQQMVDFIRQTKLEGDTAGGIIQIIVRNAPPGLGSHVHWDRKLDGQLAAALMSIQAVKGVEIGIGFQGVDLPGSQFHDEIFYNGQKLFRQRNNAGGIEGGMSNGQDIVAQIFMKPIPTLMKPLNSVDLQTGKPFLAHKERSDVTAVPACSIVAEAVVAHVIADAFCEKFGNDALSDMEQAYQFYKNRIKI